MSGYCGQSCQLRFTRMTGPNLFGEIWNVAERCKWRWRARQAPWQCPTQQLIVLGLDNALLHPKQMPIPRRPARFVTASLMRTLVLMPEWGYPLILVTFYNFWPTTSFEGDMGKISSEQAEETFGISVLHEKMPNGEFRFRLRKNDGTAYIRTESTEASGWQNSHFHSHVLETYIVQTGWMASAELIENEPIIKIHQENDIFTTKTGVIHNVYLSKNAVIHTVKHGIAEGNDRLTNEKTIAFDIVTHAFVREADLMAAAIRKGAVDVSYSEQYRHFDNLIWQVPAWATAIFALSVQSLVEVASREGQYKMVTMTTLSLFAAISLACFSFVLMRFRTHQRGLKWYNSTPAWLSASTMTQCLIITEVVILFTISITSIGVSLISSAIISTIIGLFLVIVTERSVRSHSIQRNRNVELF
jgi:hypothetical protein